MALSLKTLWAVKILLALRKASLAGAPLTKSHELLSACVNPDSDPYIYRRVLRELVAKTDYLTCTTQSGRTFYQLNPNLRPTLYDLILRLEGGVHEVANGFWSFEHSYTMHPLYEINKQFDTLTRKYLSGIYIDELDLPVLSGNHVPRMALSRP